MDNRYTVIKDLVTQACERLRKMGVSVDDNDVENMVQNLYSKDYSVEQVKRDVFRMERERRVKYEVEQMVNEPLTIARNLQNLSVQYNGITLNNQDIDLLMIANSNSFEELVEVMERVTNISLPEGMSEMDFITYRQKVFDAYLDNLSPVNESLINKDLDLFRRIEHLKESGFLTNEEVAVLNKVIMENKNFGVETILTELKKDELFGEEKVEQLVLGLREFVSVEKEGIKSTSIEAYHNLYDQINLFYDSITLDEEAKYGKVILSDGSFYDSSLRKALDFAKKMGKTMRINTLFFYMDCPDDIYNLEESSSSSKMAKERLGFYIDEITKVLAEYPDVVRSVDVFNEILNRHPLPLDVSYMVRGDIPQDIDNFDNIKSGWLKHLTVEDVCELLAIARKNLPTVDFMYNDDHLIDPDKWSATSALIERIQDYSKGMGIKLIDSIGTQMHIDNDVSKEEIRNMFIELSKFGLPIEITEFDLAMTSGLEGLSDLQIEQIRQKKINEVYEVIEELKDQCNIRGITIWSKTDSQNFRVKLANEELVSRNMEPSVSTLHGGFFTEEMISKTSGFSKNIRKQNFNFHCHTSRCGHAGNFSDRDYVIAAKNAGVNCIGFSDHVPFNKLDYWINGKKMHISEVDDYVGSIRKLADENPDMTIRCGYEAEYASCRVGHLVDLRSSCDYMILGQHFVQEGLRVIRPSDNPEYPLLYAKSVCEALDTGIFDILAHPDFFMLEREHFSTEEGKIEFLENAKMASYMICEKAKELGIPIELNVRGREAALAGVTDEFGNRKTRGDDGELSYPHSLFWEIAAEVGNDVIYSVDAHNPNHILAIDEDREFIERIIDTSKLKFVSDNYDPVLARENNLILQEAYASTCVSAVTQETAMITALLDSMEVLEGQDVLETLKGGLYTIGENFDKEAAQKMKRLDKKYKEAENKEKYDLCKKRLIATYGERHAALDRAKESLSVAQAIGCSTKDEYVYAVGLLTEAKSSDDPVKIATASEKLEIFSEKKSEENKSVTQDSAKVYVNKPVESPANNGNSSDNSSGFVSSMNLILAVVVLLVFCMLFVFMIK